MVMDNTRSWTLQELKDAFTEYADLITQSDRTLNTKQTYIVHARRFLRWLAGEAEI